jgi:toxin ParE1/3/4
VKTKSVIPRDLVFYVEQQDHINVWRVLQRPRDIPTWMQDPEKT